MKSAASRSRVREVAAGSLPALAALSLVVGAAAGLVGALFRLALEKAETSRTALIEILQRDLPGLGMVIVVALCAGVTLLAAWLVRRFSPHASGSGIPHVEAVLHREVPQAPFRLVVVKFIGGALAMGAGLALGREGPSVQMGAGIAHLIGRFFRRDLPDCLTLLAAGAGAGLATAFNAPIAGAVFVLEELVRKFDTRMTIATFGASAAAISVSRIFLGQDPDFAVSALPYADTLRLPLYLVLGIIAGLAGEAYNRAITGALEFTGRMKRTSVEMRAAIIGGGVGLIAWFAPSLVGGGDNLTQAALQGFQPLGVVAMVFGLRFALGAVSYAARTPGGLFAPLLVLGAQSGVILGMAYRSVDGSMSADEVTSLAVVGMAAFFTAVVRAPLTGIILVIEMTGNFTLLLPMLIACFAAMLVPTLRKNPPIYDTLRENTLAIQRAAEAAAKVKH